MIKNIVLLILLFTASSCLAQENLKDYYYSIGTKKEVSVYKYIDKNNLKNIEYWKVTTNPATNTILTESYTTDFRLYNIFEETITSKGAEIIRYVDFMKKNNGKIERIEGTILSKDVYKWSDSTKYTYAVKYKRPIYGNEVFTKDRTKNSFTDVNIYGKKYATVKFLDEYEIELQDRDQIYKFYQFTYYAKGIGMVKYERYHPDGTKIILELSEILTEKKFQKLKEKVDKK